MLQFNKRTAAVNMKPEEIAAVNEQLAEYQKLRGTDFIDFKSLFFDLLPTAIKEINREASEPTNPQEPAALPDNAVILTENDRVITFTPEFLQAVNDFSEINELSKELPLTEVLLSALTSEAEEPEPVTIEVERPAGPNDIRFTLDENELAVINHINQARAARFDREPVSISELVHDMTFSRGTLLNMGGEFYTGLG